MNLNLQTTQLGQDRIKVSWNDACRRDFEEGARDNFVIFAAVFFIGSAIFLLYLAIEADAIGPTAYIGLLIAVLVAMVQIIKIPTRAFPKSNSLIVTRTGLEHHGHTFDHGAISRIEYERKSQWSNVPKTCFDPMEIRVWFADKTFYVISENAWERRVNHEIKSTIDEAVAALTKRPAPQSDHTQKARPSPDQTRKSNNYGMPDY